MSEKQSVDRRTILQISTGAAVATTLAGCTETAAIHEAWGDVDEIVLEGRTDGWRGVAPATIENEVNPMLVLYEGQRYDVTVRNGDGEPHSLEVWDRAGAVVEEYRTDTVEDRESKTLSVWTSQKMAEYGSGVHDRGVRGEIAVRPESDTDIPE